MPGWVPGFMKDQIVNLAAKRSTSWVDIECKKAMGITKPKTGHAPTPLGRLSNLAARAAVVGYLLRRVIVPRELLSRLAATRVELRSPIVLRVRGD